MINVGETFIVNNFGGMRPDYEDKSNKQLYRELQRDFQFNGFLFKKDSEDMISELFTKMEFIKMDEGKYYSEALGLYISEDNFIELPEPKEDMKRFINFALSHKTGETYIEEVNYFFDEATEIYNKDCRTRGMSHLLKLQHGKQITKE